MKVVYIINIVQIYICSTLVVWCLVFLTFFKNIIIQGELCLSGKSDQKILFCLSPCLILPSTLTLPLLSNDGADWIGTSIQKQGC